MENPAVQTELRVADLHHLADAIRSKHPAPYSFADLSTWSMRLTDLEKNIGELDASGFFFRLQEVAALVDDIHTSVFPLVEQGLLLDTLPVRLRRFSDGIYIRAVREDFKWLLGSRVIGVEGHPMEAVLVRVLRLAPGNQRCRHSNVPLAYLLTPAAYQYLGIRRESGKVTLTVLTRAGELKEVWLDSEPVSLMEAYESGTVVGWKKPDGWVSIPDGTDAPTPVFYQRRGESMIWFDPLPDGETLLVQVNQPNPDQDNSVVTTLARLYSHLSTHRYRRIVIDLRGNEGGWFSLTSALPGMIASIEAGDSPPRVFVLIGPDTISAGVALAAQLEQQTNAVFVGEPTGSSPNIFGTYRPAQLPNSGIYYRVSTTRLVNSALDDDRLWIAPDVSAPERISDIEQGIDGALEAALALPQNDGASPSIPWFERWKRPSQVSARPAPTKNEP